MEPGAVNEPNVEKPRQVRLAVTLISVFALLISLPAFVMYTAFTALIAVAQLIAVILLFQKPSRAWFKPDQKSKNQESGFSPPMPFRQKK